MTTGLASIILRARITADEWRKVRVRAAERDEQPSQWVAEAIRQRLKREGK